MASAGRQQKLKLKKSVSKRAAGLISKSVKITKKFFPKKKSPQKKSSLGVEVECMILNQNGKVVNEADLLLNELAGKKGVEITNECSKNLIELGAYPSPEVENTIKALLENLEILLFKAEKEGLIICPLGTYPGECYPETRHSTLHYKAEEKLVGPNNYRLAGRCVGLHVHHALPWGVFDFKRLKLKPLVNSKHKESLVNAYNFLIAADPALCTFAQSSPFYQGKFVGKDARILIWRGDKDIDYKDSLYNDYPEYGELPPYVQTAVDLIDSIETRHKNWKKALLNAGVKKSVLPKYKSVLDTNWSPVKINAHGTIEQRGMDMNHPLIILAIVTLVGIILRAIQEDFIKVECSDMAVDEPFKLEKRTIYVPPDSYVKKELQPRVAFKGLEDDKILYYGKRILALAKELGNKKSYSFLEPLEKMIADRKTVSDEIISEAKELGYDNYKKPLPSAVASEIALNHSKRLFKEIVLTKKIVEDHWVV